MVSNGPGTGTGVATVVFDEHGKPVILEGEGGHVDFAPITDMEFEVLKHLRARFGRIYRATVVQRGYRQYLSGTCCC